MVVPRLVAPHPNAALIEATPEKCLAMVVLVRLDELQEGRTRTFAAVPTMLEAAASPEWRWQLVAGLHKYLHNGDPKQLLTLARAANEASDVAAGAVVAAAALLECGRAGEATELLEEIIQRDVASPVDHAWLQAQLARAYAESGRRLEARDLALAVQMLRSDSLTTLRLQPSLERLRSWCLPCPISEIRILPKSSRLATPRARGGVLRCWLGG
jgi:predicted nucleic acid-binding protein